MGKKSVFSPEQEAEVLSQLKTTGQMMDHLEKFFRGEVQLEGEVAEAVNDLSRASSVLVRLIGIEGSNMFLRELMGLSEVIAERLERGEKPDLSSDSSVDASAHEVINEYKQKKRPN